MLETLRIAEARTTVRIYLTLLNAPWSEAILFLEIQGIMDRTN